MKGLSSSALKWIAICSMLIDHFGVAVYVFLPQYTYEGYRMLRYIGRIAFPIYCFLLVEGFFNTRNVKRYIARCFLFALLSEIPFDLALFGKVWYPQAQNVFFTLAIGLVTLYGLERVKGFDMPHLCMQAVWVAATAVFAQWFEVDYHYLGVLFIVMFYYCRELNPWLRDMIGACVFSYEITAPLAFIPIHLYNGERGMRLKYFFYLIYPMHLLLYGCIRLFILQ